MNRILSCGPQLVPRTVNEHAYVPAFKWEASAVWVRISKGQGRGLTDIDYVDALLA